MITQNWYLGPVADKVLRLKAQHHKTWRNRPENYWFQRLVQEMGELGSSLAGDHEDTPDHELEQIAAICLNWLEMREGNMTDWLSDRAQALEQAKEKQ